MDMKNDNASARFAAIYDEADDGSILRVFGEVDLATSPEFEKSVQSATMHGKPVAIDLSECAYIDSSGLTVLARAAKRYKVPLEVIVAPKSHVARVMEITSFGKILPIHLAGEDEHEVAS